MKILNTGLLIVLTGSLLLCSACGKDNSSTDSDNPYLITETTSSEVSPVKETVATPVNETKEDGTCDIHVTIESVEISLADLEANDYIVPVYVTLDQNAGITYAEWGASFDSRCKVTSDSFDDEVRFDTVCSINDEQHFLWTAWASANLNERTGNLVLLNVELPEDTAAGDSFHITYAPVSLADKLHVWNDMEKNWVSDGVVGWTDGGITVTE